MKKNPKSSQQQKHISNAVFSSSSFFHFRHVKNKNNKINEQKDEFSLNGAMFPFKKHFKRNPRIERQRKVRARAREAVNGQKLVRERRR